MMNPSTGRETRLEDPMARALLVTLALVLTTGLSTPARAQSADRVERTETTPSYRVTLHVHPAGPIAVVETAAGAPLVEVMLPHTGAAFASAAALDRGEPVNRHLEIYVADAETGRVAQGVHPTVEIVNQATGEGRVLGAGGPMYDAEEGLGDWHYGNNLYLPAGRYTVTAIVDGERAVFSDVALDGN
jgi:hypothetical protein